ncbi:MAG TPA: beta-galactosidase [Armatimonadota bacterium]|jgi:hypothetical protein
MAIDVTIHTGYATVGDEVVPLYSGEVHFWRIQAANWRPILEKVRELGLHVVATYVAWNFHEVAPGQYDFTGETTPEHNLRGFLALTQEMGFKVLLRPGPYIYSEWPHGGVTAEAAQYHRLDPRFLALAKTWIDAVSALIAPYQATRGGHVIALQPDNEPYPAIPSQGAEIGCFDAPGLFKEWLATRYDHDLARLNHAWRTEYTAFSQAIIHWEEPYINRVDVPENGRLLPEPQYEARVLDAQEFVEWYACEIIHWTGDTYRAAGIDVPFFSNGWHPYAQNFHETHKIAPLCGVDLYPSAFFNTSTFLPGGNDWDYCMEILKVQENNCGWGYSAELESGLWEGGAGGVDLSPQSTAFMNRALIANGLKAWNWYVIVNRDNWYHSPINQFGRETPFFGAHQQVVQLAERLQLHTLHRAPAVSLVTLRRQRLTDSGNWAHVWGALTSSGVDFETVDCRYAQPQCDLILYGGSQFIEADEAANLRAAVEAGATLVVFNRFPVQNRLGEPVNPFDLPAPDGQRPIMSPFSVTWDAHSATIPHGGHLGKFWTLYFGREPEGATPIFALPLEKNAEVLVDIRTTDRSANTYRFGFIKPCGKGQVVVLGVSPFPGAMPLIKALTGKSYKIETLTAQTAVTCWAGPDVQYAFLINRNANPLPIALQLDPAVYPGVTALEQVETGERYRVDADGRAYVPMQGYEVVVVRLV